MPFHFPLQAIVHFRQSVEHQQELRLRAANQHVSRTRHMIEQLDSRTKEMQAQQSRDLGMGTTAAELFFAIQCEGSIFQHRQILQGELVRQQKLRDDQQAVFHQARRERETIESLHDQQLRAYARERSRREQRQLDDLFLLRKAYLRRTFQSRENSTDASLP